MCFNKINRRHTLRIRNVGSPTQWKSLKRTHESAAEFAVAKRVRANLELQSADVNGGNFYLYVQIAAGD